MAQRRSLMTFVVACGFFFLFFIPMRWTFVLPAILESKTDFAVHAPRDARVVSWSIKPGNRVSQGDILAVFDASDLQRRLKRVELELKLLDLRLARIAGDEDELTARTTIAQERVARLEQREGLQKELAALVVRAPVSGVLRDVDDELHPGAWVSPQSLLARLVNEQTATVRAYANEDVLQRLAVGEKGTFVPDDPQQATQGVTLREISQASANTLAISYLASVFGGPLASERESDGRVRSRRSQYVLRLSTDGGGTDKVMRGTLRLPGQAQSLASMTWQRILRVAIRETGF